MRSRDTEVLAQLETETEVFAHFEVLQQFQSGYVGERTTVENRRRGRATAGHRQFTVSHKNERLRSPVFGRGRIRRRNEGAVRERHADRAGENRKQPVAADDETRVFEGHNETPAPGETNRRRDENGPYAERRVGTGRDDPVEREDDAAGDDGNAAGQTADGAVRRLDTDRPGRTRPDRSAGRRETVVGLFQENGLHETDRQLGGPGTGHAERSPAGRRATADAEETYRNTVPVFHYATEREPGAETDVAARDVAEMLQLPDPETVEHVRDHVQFETDDHVQGLPALAPHHYRTDELGAARGDAEGRQVRRVPAGRRVQRGVRAERGGHILSGHGHMERQVGPERVPGHGAAAVGEMVQQGGLVADEHDPVDHRGGVRPFQGVRLEQNVRVRVRRRCTSEAHGRQSILQRVDRQSAEM